MDKHQKETMDSHNAICMQENELIDYVLKNGISNVLRDACSIVIFTITIMVVFLIDNI